MLKRTQKNGSYAHSPFETAKGHKQQQNKKHKHKARWILNSKSVTAKVQ